MITAAFTAVITHPAARPAASGHVFTTAMTLFPSVEADDDECKADDALTGCDTPDDP
jgi:hypothetical protein